MTLTSKDFFYCYNKDLAMKIKGEGIPVLTIAENIKTGKLFSMFQKSARLQKVIDNYIEETESN